MSKTELITVTDLKKDFIADDVVTRVLKGVSFSIAAGEFVAIMGPSGSGKSTLMHILGFLDRATGGQYLFRGEDVTRFGDEHLAKLRNQEIGFVFQTYNLLPKTSVLDNVILPLVYSKIKAREREARARAAIEAVGLTYRASYLSNQLSGGELQR